jgi:hypothetical protein
MISTTSGCFSPGRDGALPPLRQMITRQAVEQMVDHLMALPEGKGYRSFPCDTGKKG